MKNICWKKETCLPEYLGQMPQLTVRAKTLPLYLALKRNAFQDPFVFGELSFVKTSSCRNWPTEALRHQNNVVKIHNFSLQHKFQCLYIVPVTTRFLIFPKTKTLSKNPISSKMSKINPIHLQHYFLGQLSLKKYIFEGKFYN